MPSCSCINCVNMSTPQGILKSSLVGCYDASIGDMCIGPTYTVCMCIYPLYRAVDSLLCFGGPEDTPFSVMFTHMYTRAYLHALHTKHMQKYTFVHTVCTHVYQCVHVCIILMHWNVLVFGL